MRLLRPAVVLTMVLASLATFGASAGTAHPAVTSHAVRAGSYVALTPTRLLDTRSPSGGGPLKAGTPRTITVAGEAGVPTAGVSAVVVNLTAVAATSAGYLAAYPAGGTRPGTSNVNYGRGQIIANSAIVPVSASGQITVYSTAQTNLLVDVSGYFTGTPGSPAPTAAGSYVPLTPTRVVDTRTSSGGGPVLAAVPRLISLAGYGGVPATGVSAVMVNLTVTGATSAGFLAAYPAGGTRPLVSNVNYGKGQTIASSAVVAVSASGQIAVYASGQANLLVDVSGYFVGTPGAAAPTATGSYAPLTPSRLLDTRSASGGGPLAVGMARTITVAGQAGVPATGVSAVVVNLTAVAATSAGYLAAYPAGGTRPLVSNVNYGNGQTIANSAIVPVSSSGQISVYAAGQTNLIVDVSGYFVGSTSDTTAPGPVTNLVATPSTTSIALSWTNPTATDYGDAVVRRAVGSVAPDSVTSGTAVGTVTSPDDSILDTGLAADTEYSYAVFAQDATGNTSAGADTTATTAPAAPVPSLSGTVTGTDAVTGVAGITVNLTFPGVHGTVASTTTQADGTYAFYALGSASYDVCFDASTATSGSATGYLGQCYQDKPGDDSSSTPVAVAAGQDSSGIDATLTLAGGISGSVTDAGSTGIAGVKVTVDGPDGKALAATTTAAGGTYSVAGLTAGSDTVCFDASAAAGGASTTGYFDQCYEGQPADGSSSTPVVVTAGHDTSGIDATLTGVGQISGTVSDSGSGGVAGVTVTVDGHDGTALATTKTAVDGTYSVSGLAAGSDTVCFDTSTATVDSGSLGYLDQCYDGKPGDDSSSTPVAVVAGQNVSGIDAALVEAGEISGTVSDSSAGLAGVTVTLRDLAGDVLGSTETASDGTYSFPGLAAGSDTVCFDPTTSTSGSVPGEYAGQCYQDAPGDNSSSTPVPVTAGLDTANIDATLTGVGQLSGTVTDSGATAVAGVSVTVDDSDGLPVATTSTGADGTYSVSDLAPGSDTVCFDASAATGGASTTGYFDQCYEGQPADGSSSTPVAVTAGHDTSGIDATLTGVGQISGTVTDSGSGGVGGVTVTVDGPDGTEVGSTTTVADGTYSVSGLVAGNDTVCFDASAATGGSSTTGYFDQCYQAEPADNSSSTPVAVVPGQDVSGIDAALATAGGVSGTVTDSSSTGLAGVTVTLRGPDGGALGSTHTASDGTYSFIGLTTGSDTVCFDASEATGGSSTGGYVNQCYQGQPADNSSSTPVSVTAGQDSPGIDASLSSAGAISGTVSDTAGNGLGDVEYVLYDANSNYIAYGYTAADGTYTIGGLTSGQYRVCFYADEATGGSSPTGYPSECYGGSSAYQYSSDFTTVTAGTTSTGTDLVLPDAAVVTGTVTDQQGDGLASVVVNVYDAHDDFLGSGDTAADGSYTAGGLLAGQVEVCFDATNASGGPSTTGYQSQCYGGTTANDPSGSTSLTATAGETTPDIDQALPPGGAISGTVTDSGGAGVGNVYVYGYDANGDYADFTQTAADGTFTVTGLSPGDDELCVYTRYASGGSSTTGYQDQCYDGQPAFDLHDATPIPVTISAVTPGIDVTLADN